MCVCVKLKEGGRREKEKRPRNRAIPPPRKPLVAPPDAIMVDGVDRISRSLPVITPYPSCEPVVVFPVIVPVAVGHKKNAIGRINVVAMFGVVCIVPSPLSQEISICRIGPFLGCVLRVKMDWRGHFKLERVNLTIWWVAIEVERPPCQRRWSAGQSCPCKSGICDNAYRMRREWKNKYVLKCGGGKNGWEEYKHVWLLKLSLILNETKTLPISAIELRLSAIAVANENVRRKFLGWRARTRKRAWTRIVTISWVCGTDCRRGGGSRDKGGSHGDKRGKGERDPHDGGEAEDWKERWNETDTIVGGKYRVERMGEEGDGGWKGEWREREKRRRRGAMDQGLYSFLIVPTLRTSLT